jgi:hypothetical protein
MQSARINKTIRANYNAVRAVRSVYYIFSNGHKISARIGDRNELDVSGNLFYYTCAIHVYGYL